MPDEPDPWEGKDDEPGDWLGADAWVERRRPAELDDGDRHYGPEYWMWKRRADDDKGEK